MNEPRWIIVREKGMAPRAVKVDPAVARMVQQISDKLVALWAVVALSTTGLTLRLAVSNDRLGLTMWAATAAIYAWASFVVALKNWDALR